MGFGRKWMVLAALAFAGAAAAADGGHDAGVQWQKWRAGNDVTSTRSLQRGASNFVNYCLACHSLQYVRWSRVGEDLQIPSQLLGTLLPAGAKDTDYIFSSFPAADGEVWFGRAPPDLSLTARARGTDWIYQFLKGFVADPTKLSGTNNLVLDGASMPAVLSDLEGVKMAHFADGGAAGGHGGGPVVTSFEYLAPGSMTPDQFDGFVRDTVNFLDYVGDPTQAQRRHLGVWVILFLMVFTGLAWMLKREYWKDVH